MIKFSDVYVRSTAGLETTVAIPSMKICFDIGVLTPEAFQCRTVLVSHPHYDHIADLYKWWWRLTCANVSEPLRIICPSADVDIIRQQFKMTRALERNTFSFSEEPCIIGMKPGDTVVQGRLRYEAFAADHRIPALSFLASEKRVKLAAEFQGLSGQEIVQLKQQGVEVSFTEWHPVVAYTGDTRIWSLKNPDNARLLQADMLICECTFMGDISHEHSHKCGHIHMDELHKNQDLLEIPAKTLLMHISQQHPTAVVQEQMKKFELEPGRIAFKR